MQLIRKLYNYLFGKKKHITERPHVVIWISSGETTFPMAIDPSFKAIARFMGTRPEMLRFRVWSTNEVEIMNPHGGTVVVHHEDFKRIR